MIVLISLSGLYFFHQEKNPVKLWVPQDSDFVRDTEWMFKQFEQGLRIENMILTADNILEPQVLTKVSIVICIFYYTILLVTCILVCLIEYFVSAK